MSVYNQILQASESIFRATRKENANIIMGVFDIIKEFEIECPVCNMVIDNFQTKDGMATMSLIEKDTVDEFHNMCNRCYTWISFKKKEPNNCDHVMVEPDIKLYKNLKTTEDLINNITNENRQIRDYCVWKLLPIKRRRKNVR